MVSREGSRGSRSLLRVSGASERVGPTVNPTARTRVVVLLDSIRRPGGGERLAIEGVIRLDPEEFERTLCLSRWEESFESVEPARSILERLRTEDVRVVGLERSSRLNLLAWRPLVRILRRERIDVIHGHLFGSNLWATILGRLCRTPAVVAHEHMWAYTGGRLRPLLDRHLIARFSDAFVAVSEVGRRQMMEVEHIPAGDIVLIPNGISQPAPGDGVLVRSELGIPAGAPLVGSIGHLRTEKAFEVLIEAAALLGDDVHVLIVGEGPERERLEALRSRLGLDDRVHMPGARADIGDLLAAFDVAVCCSDFEGGPLSVMEYMGAALPIVVTDVGGLPELIREGETGLRVPPRAPDDLAAGIERLLSDPELGRRLGSAAAELRAAEHDVSVWSGRIADLYRRLLAGRRGRD